jgi:hypothetical protein
MRVTNVLTDTNLAGGSKCCKPAGTPIFSEFGMTKIIFLVVPDLLRPYQIR